MSDSGRKLVSIIEAHRERSLGPFLRRLARASVTAGAFTLAACSGAAVTDAGGPGTDAGSSALDGSVSRVDAGPASSDAGPGTDAGPGLTDAAAADAGPGLTDAGPGPTDAAVSDGGTIRYEAPLCDDSGNWLAVHDLATTRTPDYLDAADHQFIFYVVDSVGTACSGASDLDACNVALTAAESFFGRALRTTDGDVVERLASDVEVLGLLGSIDTKNEALLRAWLQGYTIGCSDPERWGVRVVDGGYEVLATRMVADCDPVIVNGYRLHVATDGTVTIVEM